MNPSQIRRLATQFRKGVLGKRHSTDCCFVVSWPLQGYLAMRGEKWDMQAGFVNGWRHCWLEREGVALDPTADQFKAPDGTEMPAVYVGARPAWYSLTEPRRRKKAGSTERARKRRGRSDL